MDVLDGTIEPQTLLRRCHLWCWSPSLGPAEWERRTLVVGGLSPLGLLAAGVSAAVSAAGNRRRRAEALAAAAPGWRYVASGAGWAENGRLVVRGEMGGEWCFDLNDLGLVESPAPGWLRVRCAGSSALWAIQFM